MSHRADQHSPLPDDWVVPVVDATNRDWFTSGALAVQQCDGCGTRQHPPEEVCHVCGSMSFSPAVVEPVGTVHSYTVVHHSVHPALDASVPYAVVLVALDAAPELRVVGNLLDVSVDEVRIGMPVTATWVTRTGADGAPLLLPQWQRAGT